MPIRPAAACLLSAALALAGCGPGAFAEPGGAFLAANAAAIPVIHRTLIDAVWSVVSGRDCSLVYLDRFERYCRPEEPPPEPPRYCTRSLGTVDCWATPATLPRPVPREVADGPRTLNPAQEADRTRHWPF
jgi:hypothetical protein